MRLLILTQYFPPETGAPQNRLFELAVCLKKLGVEVVVLTSLPNYPKMKIFREYRWCIYKKERINGIEVHRSFIYVSSSRNLFLRLINYFSFVITSFITAVLKLGRFDYLLCESPPLFLGITACAIKKLKCSKLIFNVSDLWPESAEKLGLITNKYLLRITKKLEEFIYKKSQLITGQTQGIVENISVRFPEKEVYWLKNGVDLDYFNPERVSDYWRLEAGFGRDDFILLYAGIFGYAQGIKIILSAAKKLENNKMIKFVLVGDGPEKISLIREKENQKLENVYFFPSIPKNKMPSILKSIDATIIPLRKLDLFKGAIPSKIFESLAMQKPILLGVEGEAKEIFIDQGKSGLFFEPENVNDFAEKILLLFKDMSLRERFINNSRIFVEAHFNRNVIAADFYKLLVKNERN